MSVLAEIPAPVARRAEKPANRWRNKWFIPWKAAMNRKYSRMAYGPTEDWDDEIFPSQDLALTDAEESIADWRTKAYPKEKWPVHLGAFEVDETGEPI